MAIVRELLNRLIVFGRVLALYFRSRIAGTSAADHLIAEGNLAEKDGRLNEACELYRKAVDAVPGYAKAHLNLGIGLQAAGDAEGAMESYEAALEHDPRDAYAYYNLANLLYAHEDSVYLERIEQLLRTALQLKPEFPEAGVALANVYDSQGNFAAAAAAMEIALKQRPDYAGAWRNYGNILFKMNRLINAEAALRHAIQIDPSDLTALRLLGTTLSMQSRLAEARVAIGAARKIAPERFDLESMELHSNNLSDEISREAIFAGHKAFGARLEKAFPQRFEPFRNNRAPGRRLRVGYMSSDFNNHPVALFCIPVFERHDRSAYEVYCYSTSSKIDEVTERLRTLADVWREGYKISDPDLAELINRDAIDVLVDLTGHGGTIRLGVFAQQPAPVQVSWLGYMNTTGLTRIHYRLCDAYTDPPGITDHLYTETLVRLPHSQWCYRPLFPNINHAVEPPLEKNGFVTFGSFNHIVKISKTTRRLWSEILTRLPDSRLVVMGMQEEHTRNSLLQDFLDAKISASRVTMVPRVPLEDYFHWFNAIDIALDTTPYSGGTTTCDTLWMGVPVVTHPGLRSVSRSTASILTTVGLHDWIASTPEEYVQLALRFARERAVISELRKSLRQRMRESPLMDEPQFICDLEDAYRRMWRTWCDGPAK